MFSLLKYVFFALLFLVTNAAIIESDCQSATGAQVETFVAQESGFSVQEVRDRLALSDEMALRSFDKTWATHLSLAEYQNAPLPDEIRQADKGRFSFPDGESSGGYGISTLPANEMLRMREGSARRSAELTFQYMLKLSVSIDGFASLIPENVFDQGCDGRYRSTHAELKSLTRLMTEGRLPLPADRSTAEGTNVFLAVSRHMCSYCRRILMHLALNGQRKIFIASPRAGSRNDNQNVFRPEYGVFQRDGSLITYQRNSNEARSAWRCKMLRFDQPPAGATDGFIPPDTTAAGLFQPDTGEDGAAAMLRALNISIGGSKVKA